MRKSAIAAAILLSAVGLANPSRADSLDSTTDTPYATARSAARGVNVSQDRADSRYPGVQRATGKPTHLHSLVTHYAVAYGVSPAVAHAIVRKESAYRCNLRDGIMQTKPATARGEGVYGNLRSCDNGLRAGMSYLSKIVRVHGVSCASLGLYQRGAYARPVCTRYGRHAMQLAGMNSRN